uniref:Uncharacterized protein n=1 Tax=Tetradesmus obliquus TaxID=3088 RepID=A0A383WFE1_TETOB|eukprot:jgi/Sobl393_1/18684/SZX75963.1
MQYKDNRQQATSQFSKETASFMRGSTGSWVDLVSSQTASFQPPASQATQLVQVPRPSPKRSSPGKLPAFRPSIQLQQQMQAAQDAEQQQQQQHQQQCRRVSCKPGMDREAEKDHLAAVFALGREGAAALQHASLARTTAAAVAAKQRPAASVKEQLVNQVIEELNARTQLLQELQQQGGAAAAEQARLVKAEIRQRVLELRRLGVTAGEA